MASTLQSWREVAAFRPKSPGIGSCHQTVIKLQSCGHCPVVNRRRLLQGDSMRFAASVLAIGLGVLTCGAQAQQITGAGATFPAPVYTKWGEAAKAAIGIELNYQAIGSGSGQNQIMDRTVDFGASDAPVEGPKLEANRLPQFPTVMVAGVRMCNIPG